MTSSDLPKLWTSLSKISKFRDSKSLLSIWNWLNLFKNKILGRIFDKETNLYKLFFFWKFWFLKYFIYLKCAQFLSALFIILVSLTMTLFSEKVLISNRCINGLLPNLIKKSWTDSITYVTQGKCSQVWLCFWLLLLFVCLFVLFTIGQNTFWMSKWVFNRLL